MIPLGVMSPSKHQSTQRDEESGLLKKSSSGISRDKDLTGPTAYNVSEIENNDYEEDDHHSDSASDSGGRFRTPNTILVALLISFLGVAASVAFMAVGISTLRQQSDDEFARVAFESVNFVESAFTDYVSAASLVHARCRHRDFSRQDFRELHEYLVDSGLSYKAVQFDPLVFHAERAAREDEARAYYQENYPHVNYQGFRGFNTLNSTSLEPRTVQEFYYPIHYMEPIPGNEAAIDLDYYSSESRIRAVKSLLENKGPSLTDRLSLVRSPGEPSRCGDHDGPSYGVVLMHPGVQLEEPQPGDEVWPKDFSSMVLCVPEILRRSITREAEIHAQIYIHDQSTPEYVSEQPVFMGGIQVRGRQGTEDYTYAFLDEVPYSELQDLRDFGRRDLLIQEDVHVANRIWTVSVIADQSQYQPDVVFVVLGGIIVFAASVALSVWVYTNGRRTAAMHNLRAESDAEKARLILEGARNAAKAERELNDFISHEVRNPVAAAMAALNFVKIEMAKPEPLQTKSDITQFNDDIRTVDNSLLFVNDLLRNMLDMHRASTKQLQVTKTPTDLLHDVLEPVGSMLFQRGSKVKILVECPPGLHVVTDPLRLKQVVMNLGRNSSKFIEKGFIRLKGQVIDNSVVLYVEDSGCGIPKDKQEQLFTKYQESLDLLNQGTGIGLYLCKLLVELMGGNISLDGDYNSGIRDNPGARFIIDLQSPPVEMSQTLATMEEINSDGVYVSKDGQSYNFNGSVSSASLESSTELPENLSVLFVDDDAILRKLFIRSLRNLMPGWTLREAASGETAIKIFEAGERFDLVFVDMYMASVEKQLLGTETVAELRRMGIKSRLCGLSANDKEQEFLEAGADAFLFKPFPCDPVALSSELCRVLDITEGSRNSMMDIMEPLEEHEEVGEHVEESDSIGERPTALENVSHVENERVEDV